MQDITRDLSELRLGIVHVEKVDGFNSEIVPGAFQLVFEVLRCHAMHAAGQLLGIKNAGLHVLPHEIAAGVGGHVAIEGEIACLGADEDLIPFEFSGSSQLLQSCADVAFGALVAVVDGAVEHIDAGAQGSGNGLYVRVIGCIIGLAQVRA